MATQVTLLTNLSSGLIKSSDIPTIEASISGGDSVNVWLAPDAEDPDNAIYATTLYAYDGKIAIYELGELIEEDMRRRGLVICSYDLHIGSHCKTMDVLYCDYIAEGFDTENSFLTTLSTQRVYIDSNVLVTLVGNASGPTVIHGLMVHDADDTYSDDKHNRYEHFEVESEDDMVPGEVLSVPFYDWVDRYTSYNPTDGVHLLNAVIRNGQRSKVVYFMPGKPDIRLVFMNCFNAYESLDLKGLLTDKTKVIQETAIVAGKRVAYNRRTEKEYEFVSEGLTESEALSIDQLLNSHKVWVMFNGKATPIIITDHTCEIDNNNEAQPSIKFTWTFADLRPHLNPDVLAASLREPGIFTKEFTYQFC
ncbi:MAG: hypothetical protein K2M07_08375 [Muribaculaceae bacterium]|nr:hypothetical protein [Muribaculaceae bacterium]